MNVFITGTGTASAPKPQTVTALRAEVAATFFANAIVNGEHRSQDNG